MATTGAVAKMRFEAQRRIAASLEKLASDQHKIEELRYYGMASRNPEFTQARQLEVIAELLEEVSGGTPPEATDDGATDDGATDEGLSDNTAKILNDAGYDSDEAIRNASDEELLAIDGIGPKKLEEIRAEVG